MMTLWWFYDIYQNIINTKVFRYLHSIEIIFFFHRNSLKNFANPLKAPDNAIPYDSNQNNDGSTIDNGFGGRNRYLSSQGTNYQGGLRNGFSLGRGFQGGSHFQQQGDFGNNDGLQYTSSRSSSSKTECVNKNCETTTCINKKCTFRVHQEGFWFKDL